MANNGIIPAWERAQQIMAEKYKPEQLTIIRSAQSVADILAYLDRLKTKQRAQASFQRLDKVRPLLDGLKRFDDVLKIYSGSNAAAALIWGSIKLILEVLIPLHLRTAGCSPKL